MPRHHPPDHAPQTLSITARQVSTDKHPQPLHPLQPNNTHTLTTQMPLPSPELSLSLDEYVRVLCAILDIPVYEGSVNEALHVLFTLYMEFKNNQVRRSSSFVFCCVTLAGEAGRRARLFRQCFAAQPLSAVPTSFASLDGPLSPPPLLPHSTSWVGRPAPSCTWGGRRAWRRRQGPSSRRQLPCVSVWLACTDVCKHAGWEAGLPGRASRRRGGAPQRRAGQPQST
jgi:hypothetical protein